MRAIVKDSFERLAALKTDPKKALKGGIWLSSTYIRAYRQLKLTDKEKQEFPPEKDLEKIIWGYAPKTHFDRIKDSQNKERSLRFKSKTDVSASDALEAALKGPLLVDCGATCQLATHKALRDIFGKDWYDQNFMGNLCIGLVDQDPLLEKYLKSAETIDQQGKKVFQISTGKWTSIMNHDSYIQKHRFGSFQAYNLIYAGKGKYLGLELNPEGLTKKELNELLVSEYNKAPSTDLNGLVSKKEYENGIWGLLFGAMLTPITTNDQIKEDQIVGFDPKSTLEYNYQNLNGKSC